jgi:sec-independent protein translocase protein TatC
MVKSQKIPFWDHVYELRRRLIIAVIFVFVFSVGGFLLYPQIYRFIYEVIKEKLLITEVTESFFTIVAVSITVGLFFSLPILLFEATLFIFPALTKREKTIMLACMVSSFILFTAGIFFAYKLVLPITIDFLTSDIFLPAQMIRLISYHKFITFFVQFLIAFGICFQFPLILLLLLKFKILSTAALLKHFKHFVIGVFVAAAIITPPDVVSQILLAVPLLCLYLTALAVAKLLGWGK